MWKLQGIHLYPIPFLTQSIGFILSLIYRAKGYLPVPKNTMQTDRQT